MLHPALASTLLFCVSCAGAPVLHERKLVDLTLTLEEHTATLPGQPPFEYERDAQRLVDGSWQATGEIRGPEFSGTHLIAPMHAVAGRNGSDQVPLYQLVAPIRVLDVRSKCRSKSDYAVSRADLEQHERTHGRIPSGAALLVRTGWDQFWGSPERYFGPADAPRFPVLAPDFAQALVEKEVDLVGTDAPGVDPAASERDEALMILGEANIPALAGLTRLDLVPTRGATLIALPLKIDRGGGGPTRVVAIVP